MVDSSVVWKYSRQLRVIVRIEYFIDVHELIDIVNLGEKEKTTGTHLKLKFAWEYVYLIPMDY